MEDIKYLMEKRYKVVCPTCGKESYACKSLMMVTGMANAGWAGCPGCGQGMAMTFNEEKQEFDAEKVEEMRKRALEKQRNRTGSVIKSSEDKFYEYVVLRNDGNIDFGVEAGREGGITLSPDFVIIEKKGKPTLGTYEDYFNKSRIRIEHIRKDNPEWYKRILIQLKIDHMKFFEECDDIEKPDGSRREEEKQ